MPTMEFVERVPDQVTILGAMLTPLKRPLIRINEQAAEQRGLQFTSCRKLRKMPLARACERNQILPAAIAPNVPQQRPHTFNGPFAAGYQPSSVDFGRLLTAEAAETLGAFHGTVRAWAEAGKIPMQKTVRARGVYRVRERLRASNVLRVLVVAILWTWRAVVQVRRPFV